MSTSEGTGHSITVQKVISPAGLLDNIRQKQSFLCIGLDSDINRIPRHLLRFDDPVFEFNRQIIEATSDLAVAYKPNTAFYEANGAEGWKTLAKTLEAIPKDIFTIADAKRGDIGNTSRQYARAFFEKMNFDAITVAPYMGKDSVAPFLEFDGKWVFLLALTSNSGSKDFQWHSAKGTPLFKEVITTAQEWAKELPGHLGFVVGATQTKKLAEIRSLAPDNFFLVPGVGAQGGSLDEVAKYGMNDLVGLLVNSSRGIIYAGDGEDFAEKAREKALEVQAQMAALL